MGRIGGYQPLALSSSKVTYEWQKQVFQSVKKPKINTTRNEPKANSDTVQEQPISESEPKKFIN